MIITQTPLRVGLVGGGTDLPSYYREHGGRVLNAAIDKYVYVVVKQRFDDDIYVNYSEKEIVGRVEDIRHDLVREAMHMAGVRHGVEITTLADIPSAGSGLGSSSSVTVGLLQALFAYQGTQLSAAELAERACTIELDRCGKPIGKQDQYVAAYGGICDLRFGPGDWVGVALNKSWEAKRSLASGVSNSVLDAAVDAALEAGATGAKVAGAGGGGFVLVVCPVVNQAAVRAALPEMKELPIKIDPYGSRVVLNVHRDIWG
jgi:galactokinase/mevalonate kinase-like predicted kinase